MAVSIDHLRAFPRESDEIAWSIDAHYEMAAALVRARHIIEHAPMDEEEKADLLVALNSVYRYLRTPLDMLVQDAGGRCN